MGTGVSFYPLPSLLPLSLVVSGQGFFFFYAMLVLVVTTWGGESDDMVCQVVLTHCLSANDSK